ncbi:VOC family protein [Chitinophaga tropicalis]|uniref:VOC family protein n=1 Tax=Chitinophaga tropicalis TaxID=2683588 RepID=A0A7K1U5K0_9BACT|nr:VOC family protein [Chitinophaga tropicalis]MVT09556.1 VOC family protein [Chitinophaga tropicalis]
MASVSTYLNFQEKTEEAFNFYKSIFGGEFQGAGIMRMGDAPPQEGMPPLSEKDKNLVMHVELRILGVHTLMGTDSIGSCGMQTTSGNNMHVNLDPGTRAETKRIFDRLKEGGNVTMELQDMFWGDYFGSLTDKYGINWMFNCPEKP